MAGGQLFGFAGVLLALPAAAAGTVIVRFAYNNYKLSEVYQASHAMDYEGADSAGNRTEEEAPEERPTGDSA
jgi:hypothetical protein